MGLSRLVFSSWCRNGTAAVLFSFFLLSVSVSVASIANSYSEADELLLFQDMELVVSASRQKQPENLLSVPVTVLTAEDLHYGGHSSIPEALRYVPGVDVLRMDRNRYAVGIHGLEGMFSDRMMTLVDGMPADSPAFGGPEFSSLPVMMEDIERIEIVRGSGGAAWGANALSGVVNIITKDPTAVAGLFVTSTVSGFGDSSSQVRYAESSGNWNWLLSAGYNDLKSSADVLDLSEGEGGNDQQRRKIARGELVYQGDSDVKYTFGLGVTGTDEGAFETAGVTNEEDNELNTGNGYVKAEKIFSSDTEGYVRWASRYQDMDRPSYGSAQYRVVENDFEGQMNMTGFVDHSLAFGANYRNTRLSSRPVEENIFTLAEENVREQWFGVFGSDRYQVSRQVFLEAQLRADYFSAGETDWSGRISSLYGMDALMNHVLRFSAAKSYRQPVGFIRDAYFFTTPSTSPFSFQFLVDPEMDTEQAWSLESGYQWKIREHIQFKSDLYYMWYSNLIGGQTVYDVSAAGTQDVYTIVTNTGDAEGYGFELEVDYCASPLRWTLWYAYNDFETEHEKQSIRSFLPAKNKIGLTLRWEIDENWTLNGQYAYSDLVEEDVSGNSIDASTHMDLTISRSFFGKKGEVMLGVMDLLSNEYDPVIGLDQTGSNPIPGRTFFGRLQYTF